VLCLEQLPHELLHLSDVVEHPAGNARQEHQVSDHVALLPVARASNRPPSYILASVADRSPLLVVDAPSLLFRAYHALPASIKDGEGRPVNALLGSVNIMLNEIATHGPRVVVMAFGQDAADYRVELFPAYHADRRELEADEDIERQFDAAPDLYEAFGWESVSVPGLEADDVLGSYALAERDAGGRTLILTGDRDMFQCVAPECTVLYLTTGSRGAVVVDEREVRRRYGVPPALVPDFIALRGDPSDGIPGAPGIGEKTAADLLQRHGSLEGAIAKPTAERPRVAAALRDGADQLRAYREIATLRRVDVEPPGDRPTDLLGGAAAARALGMNRLAGRLDAEAAKR
jgi:5'-3' exonuclease